MGLWYLMLSIAGLATIANLGFQPRSGAYASYYAGGADDVPRLGLVAMAAARQPNWGALAALGAHGPTPLPRFRIGPWALIMVTAWFLWIHAGRRYAMESHRGRQSRF